MNRIVVASDSFKGSLSSMEVAEAVEKGLLMASPECEVCKVEVADGGEGTVAAIVRAWNGTMHTVVVSNPLGRPVSASYGIIQKEGKRMAVMEMAAASGLPLLRQEERDVWRTSTYGTGEMILDAIRRGCRSFLVGIGGSATNDGGTGMLSALGVRFLDASGAQLTGCGANLERIAAIDMSGLLPEVKASTFVVACDVDSPFCGPQGAAYVFAPQKGATPEVVERLDKGMFAFARVVEQQLGINMVPMKGAGAAGGLGGAFRSFLSAKLERGIEMVLDAISFDSLLHGADLVITGEGRVDSQTPKGKVVAGVVRHANLLGVPVVVIGGSVEMCPEIASMKISGIYSIVNDSVSVEQAMQKEFACACIARIAAEILSCKK